MFDAIVIGAGLVGLLTTRSLAKRGYKVLLLECDAIGFGASWAGGGILSPLYPWHHDVDTLAFCQESVALYPKLIRELRQFAAIDYQQRGMLICDDRDHPQFATWQAKQSFKLNAQHPYTDAPTSGVYLDNVATVNNADLIKALVLALQASPHVSIKTHCKVQQLLHRGQKIYGVNTELGSYYAGDVIICCGAFSQRLLRPLGFDSSIVPVKGQIMALRYPVAADTPVIIEQGCYLVPRAGDQILVGSTVEPNPGDRLPDQKAYQQLCNFAKAHCPQCEEHQIQAQWTGFRPYRPQGPWVGPVPSVKGLWMNAGHYRLGLTLAPASAERLVSNMLASTANPVRSAETALVEA